MITLYSMNKYIAIILFFIIYAILFPLLADIINFEEKLVIYILTFEVITMLISQIYIIMDYKNISKKNNILALFVTSLILIIFSKLFLPYNMVLTEFIITVASLLSSLPIIFKQICRCDNKQIE